MYRSVLFLLLIAAAALGAAWVADQTGNVMLTWDGWRIETSLPVFALAVGVTILVTMLTWSILRGLWRTPAKIRRSRHERRHARGRHAITHGLLAIGHGDASAARAHADAARRHAANDPLALLLHAQSAQLEGDLSRQSVMEAIKLAPTLVPAAVLASKYESEAHQVRRAMRIVEAAWVAQPHPDLADAYAHVRLGDSARQRLVRVETLAAKAPGHLESALAVARAAIDASEFSRAREALTPFIAAPTQRVAMLMAE